jgi:hypothetical protein
MRVSRTQAEQNRQTVIDVASRLFRENGFDGIGIKDLMKAAGLTQGAFYKQFAQRTTWWHRRRSEHWRASPPDGQPQPKAIQRTR